MSGHPSHEALLARGMRAAREATAAQERGDPSAPVVNVPVTVLPAPTPTFDWEHTPTYDAKGRIVKMISRRVPSK